MHCQVWQAVLTVRLLKQALQTHLHGVGQPHCLPRNAATSQPLHSNAPSHWQTRSDLTEADQSYTSLHSEKVTESCAQFCRVEDPEEMSRLAQHM